MKKAENNFLLVLSPSCMYICVCYRHFFFPFFLSTTQPCSYVYFSFELEEERATKTEKRDGSEREKKRGHISSKYIFLSFFYTDTLFFQRINQSCKYCAVFFIVPSQLTGFERFLVRLLLSATQQHQFVHAIFHIFINIVCFSDAKIQLLIKTL